MASADPPIAAPHFPIAEWGRVPAEQATAVVEGADSPWGGSPNDLASCLIRGADCLTAALAECTCDAGLNEPRYRVLETLHRLTGGECSQAKLARLLLQSESNLSTLLDRMGGDGLISRERSPSDRRRSLIRMTPLGAEALFRAERARAIAMTRLLTRFGREELEKLAEGMVRLVREIEGARETRTDSAGSGSTARSPSPPAVGRTAMPSAAPGRRNP